MEIVFFEEARRTDIEGERLVGGSRATLCERRDEVWVEMGAVGGGHGMK